jgi:hypothetical protein
LAVKINCMPQNIFSRKELNLKANVAFHYTMPISFLATDTLFSLIQTHPFEVQQGNQILIQIGDGKGTTLSKMFYLIPTVPLIIAFKIPSPEIAITPFIGISFTSNVSTGFAFSAANQYPEDYVDGFRN